jgi:hypothetical protein
METAKTIPMKITELEGHKLDWAVAKAFGQENEWMHDHKIGYINSPSTDWAQGGPIIERELIWLEVSEGKCYAHQDGLLFQEGPTPLIAAMRCFVASKLGREIEIPQELAANTRNNKPEGPSL